MSSSNISADASARERSLEDQQLLATYHAGSSSELIGHGFGATYRDPTGATASFAATSGTFYAYNFYLWLLVKGGAIGFGLWMCFALVPVLRRIRRPATPRLAAATGAVSMLVVSIVAPIPLESDSASCLVLGALLGAAAAYGAAPAKPGSPRPVARTLQAVRA